MKTVAAIPAQAAPRSLLPAFIAGAVAAAFDFGDWLAGGGSSVCQSANVIATVLIWFVAGYWTTASYSDTRHSWKGLALFSLAAFILIAPALIGLAAAFLLRGAYGVQNTALVLLTTLGLSAFLGVFLSAWPLAQSRVGRFVSPIRIWTATKGHRWGLILMAVIMNSFSRTLPAITTAHRLRGAILLLLGHIVVNGMVIIGYSSLAVAAWLFARQQDVGLDAHVGSVFRSRT